MEQKSNRKTLTYVAIGCGVVAVLCICAFIAVFALGLGGALALTQPAADTGEAFMTALKNGDYAGAYKLCAPSLQRELGSAQRLQQLIEGGRARPTQWAFTSRDVNNDRAALTGTVTMIGGEGTVALSLINTGGEWKIVAFDLKAK
jgi:hypothetical protein